LRVQRSITQFFSLISSSSLCFFFGLAGFRSETRSPSFVQIFTATALIEPPRTNENNFSCISFPRLSFFHPSVDCLSGLSLSCCHIVLSLPFPVFSIPLPFGYPTEYSFSFQGVCFSFSRRLTKDSRNALSPPFNFFSTVGLSETSSFNYLSLYPPRFCFEMLSCVSFSSAAPFGL